MRCRGSCPRQQQAFRAARTTTLPSSSRRRASWSSAASCGPAGRAASGSPRAARCTLCTWRPPSAGPTLSYRCWGRSCSRCAPAGWLPACRPRGRCRAAQLPPVVHTSLPLRPMPLGRLPARPPSAPACGKRMGPATPNTVHSRCLPATCIQRRSAMCLHAPPPCLACLHQTPLHALCAPPCPPCPPCAQPCHPLHPTCSCPICRPMAYWSTPPRAACCWRCSPAPPTPRRRRRRSGRRRRPAARLLGSAPREGPWRAWRGMT